MTIFDIFAFISGIILIAIGSFLLYSFLIKHHKQNAGFTIETIIDSESSEIAEKLGIDSYIGEIIHKETSKAISKVNPDLLIN